MDQFKKNPPSKAVNHKWKNDIFYLGYGFY